MKKLSMIALIVLASLGSVFAQHGAKKSSDQRIQTLVAGLTTQLGLTPDVAEKVKTIFATQAPKLEALKATMKAAEDKKAVRSEMKALNEDTNKQLESVLSADQFAKYKMLEENRKKEMMSKEGGDKKVKKAKKEENN